MKYKLKTKEGVGADCKGGEWLMPVSYPSSFLFALVRPGPGPPSRSAAAAGRLPFYYIIADVLCFSNIF